MIDALKKAWRVRVAQGRQAVPDLRAATPPGYRGLPRVDAARPCLEGCTACLDVCPADALTTAPVRFDLGRCTLCGDCVAACPAGKLELTAEHRLASTTRDGLVTGEGRALEPVRVAERLRAAFGRSVRLRQVSAGGCNGCELELNALANVNFDVQRHGIEWVASPRHADGLVLTGPLTTAMAAALQLCWDAMPEPRFLVAVGACAISGGVFAGSDALDRSFLDRVGPVLYVPGCPPHPLAIATGLLDLLGIPSS